MTARGTGSRSAGKAAEPEAPDAEVSHQTWDDFWAEVEREEAAERGDTATETIRDVEVAVPHDLPLRFQHRLDGVQTQEKAARARMSSRAARVAELNAERARGVDVAEELEKLTSEAGEQDTAAEAEALDNTKALLVDLFGRDVLGQWVDNGMTENEFQVVLLWGMAHGKGQPMTFREAYVAFRRAEGKDPTAVPAAVAASPEKPAAPASKPSARKKPPAATGGARGRLPAVLPPHAARHRGADDPPVHELPGGPPARRVRVPAARQADAGPDGLPRRGRERHGPAPRLTGRASTTHN